MSEQWEYKLLVGHGLGQRLKDSTGVDYGVFSEELLNRLGRAGWEVCSHNLAFGSASSLVVKRRLVGERGSDLAGPA